MRSLGRFCVPESGCCKISHASSNVPYVLCLSHLGEFCVHIYIYVYVYIYIHNLQVTWPVLLRHKTTFCQVYRHCTACLDYTRHLSLARQTYSKDAARCCSSEGQTDLSLPSDHHPRLRKKQGFPEMVTFVGFVIGPDSLVLHSSGSEGKEPLAQSSNFKSHANNAH